MKYRKPKKTVSAAIRIDDDLYTHVMNRVDAEDSNFSRYVRNLIRRDLGVKKPKSGTRLPVAHA